MGLYRPCKIKNWDFFHPPNRRAFLPPTRPASYSVNIQIRAPETSTMGRELQKRKARSGKQKVQRHHKSKKLMLQNPIIAANWDKKKTLSQNYKTLGLTRKLNKATGGVERFRALTSDDSGEEEDPLAIEGLKRKPKIPNTDLPEVRIERDPETGAILRVVDDDIPSVKANPLNDMLNDVDMDSADEKATQDWMSLGRVPAESRADKSNPHKTHVVAALEAVAAGGVRKAPRLQSTREKDWIEQLVEKHGDDYEAMFKDRTLNVMQQSVGDIKRRVQKWQRTQNAAE